MQMVNTPAGGNVVFQIPPTLARLYWRNLWPLLLTDTPDNLQTTILIHILMLSSFTDLFIWKKKGS